MPGVGKSVYRVLEPGSSVCLWNSGPHAGGLRWRFAAVKEVLKVTSRGHHRGFSGQDAWGGRLPPVLSICQGTVLLWLLQGAGPASDASVV